MIKQTEEEAERILREAQQKAAQMVADAEANGAALCESAEQETIAAAKVVIGQLRDKAENMRERLDTEAKGEAAEIVRQASLRKRSAEKIVIRGLASKCR
jgi:vacuolar-type H+-ATPase subunit H